MSPALRGFLLLYSIFNKPTCTKIANFTHFDDTIIVMNKKTVNDYQDWLALARLCFSVPLTGSWGSQPNKKLTVSMVD